MIDGTVHTLTDALVEAAPPAAVVTPRSDALPEVTEVRNPQPPAWLVKLLKWIFPIAAVLFIALIAIPGFLQKWLWMRQLDYTGIFWTLVSVKVALTLAGFAIAFLFLWLNVRHASGSSLRASPREAPGAFGKTTQSASGAVTFVRHIGSHGITLSMALVSAMFASGLYSQWDTYLRFHYGGAYGLSDPVFGFDLGFYMFRLPWYELLQTSLVVLAGLTLVAVLMQYACVGLLRFKGRRVAEPGHTALQHTSGLLFILIAAFGWG